MRKNIVPVLSTTVIAGLLLAGCASEEQVAPVGEHAIEGEFFVVEDPWIKATEASMDTASDQTMTGAFAHLTNVSGEDRIIVGANAAMAEVVELHEVVDDGGVNLMQEKAGGFPVAVDQRYELNPGEDHIMLMELAEEIQPGDVVEITLELDNGETQAIEFLAKEFVGAQENYGDLEDDDLDHGETIDDEHAH